MLNQHCVRCRYVAFSNHQAKNGKAVIKCNECQNDKHFSTSLRLSKQSSHSAQGATARRPATSRPDVPRCLAAHAESHRPLRYAPQTFTQEITLTSALLVH